MAVDSGQLRRTLPALIASEMSLFGLGPFFWSLVLGTAVSLLMERDGWKRLGPEVADGDEGPVAAGEEAPGTVEP